MIFHAMKKLGIFKSEQEFYQIRCIALSEASLRFNEEKENLSLMNISFSSVK